MIYKFARNIGLDRLNILNYINYIYITENGVYFSEMVQQPMRQYATFPLLSNEKIKTKTTYLIREYKIKSINQEGFGWGHESLDVFN